MSKHVIFFDGASRGNPGHAASAFVIALMQGAIKSTVCEAGRYLGRTANNVAEYEGLIAGLEEADERKLRNVCVQGDSQLVINQVIGTWRVNKPHLRPLCERAKFLAQKVGVIEWKWIPRAENSHADGIANQAIDQRSSGQVKRSFEVEPEPAIAVANPEDGQLSGEVMARIEKNRDAALLKRKKLSANPPL
jgi:ribonuclease HI